MSAKDKIHDAVKNALIKDGWTITADPFMLEYGDDQLFADLAAERPLAAEKAGCKIVVEIKSFIGLSAIQDFKEALGKYILYQTILTENNSDYKLYLAISEKAYSFALQKDIIQLAIKRQHVQLLIVNIEQEKVVAWTN